MTEEKPKITKLPPGYSHGYAEHWYKENWYDNLPNIVEVKDVKFTYGSGQRDFEDDRF